MKKLLILLIIPFLSLHLFADEVDLQKAQDVANTFLTQDLNLINPSIELVYERTIFIADFNERTIYYVFNINQTEGYIIISGEDTVTPILAYSLSSYYEPNNLSPSFTSWVSQYVDLIVQLIQNNQQQNNQQQNTEIEFKWNLLSDGIGLTLFRSSMSVGPLLTTEWGQGSPYNDLCPGGSLTGCTATAMAQIANYWACTNSGNGYYSYSHPSWGFLDFDYDNTVFDWANMLDEISNSSNSDAIEAISTLMYACGVGASMDYGLGGSAAWFVYAGSPTHGVGAMVDHLGFSEDGVAWRDFYNDAQWSNLLDLELNSLRPIAYTGINPDGSSGHAFVCDGYDNFGFYHFNWGWSGGQDGYFAVTDLTPGSYDFGADNRIALGLICEETVVSGCTDANASNHNPSATFDDNSCQYDCDFLLSSESIYLGINVSNSNCQLYYNMGYTTDYLESIGYACECVEPDDCAWIPINFSGGLYQGVVSWELIDANGNTVVFGGTNDPEVGEVCLADGCYTVSMYDSLGNGWDDNVLTINDQTFELTSGFSETSVFVLNADCDVYGCTDETAQNYNEYANIDDDSCEYNCETWLDTEALYSCYYYMYNYDDYEYTIEQLEGYGYDCNCVEEPVDGCMDEMACNYNSNANLSTFVNCDYSCLPCSDEEACNFGETGNCTYPEEGANCECVSGVPVLYVPGSTLGYNTFTIIDCDENIIAEMALGENNYYNDCLVLDDNYIINLSSNSFTGGWNDATLIIANSTYTFSEGFITSFEVGDCSMVVGCTDSQALNYCNNCNIDDGSCLYVGCTDPIASNYCDYCDFDDDSCIYVDECILEDIGWSYEITSANMTFLVNDNEITFNGADIDSEGALFGGFYLDDNNNYVCGGYVELDGSGTNFAIALFAADAELDNGFQEGDDIFWILNLNGSNYLVNEIQIADDAPFSTTFVTNGFGQLLDANVTCNSICEGENEMLDLEVAFGYVCEAGWIDIAVTGGTQPYSYSWSNGATTEDLSDLPEGIYSVTVMDDNGCELMSEPIELFYSPLEVAATIISESCPGMNDGSIDIEVYGGTPPYTYYWSNGATSQNLVNLSAGSYLVEVIDGSECIVPWGFSVPVTSDYCDCNDVNACNYNPDIDDDGVPNDLDNDIDGDGISNNEDPDMDGDGILNEYDDNACDYSCFTCSDVSSFCEINTQIEQFLVNLNSTLQPNNSLLMPIGYMDYYYQENFQIHIPSDTIFLLDFGAGPSEFTAQVNSAELSAIEGLPNGLEYNCNTNDCSFSGGDYGCASITGAPSETGYFALNFIFNINGSLELPDGTIILVQGEFSNVSDYYLQIQMCNNQIIEGCTDPNYMEYNPDANTDDGSCLTMIVNGCIDNVACNYSNLANVDDGSCWYAELYYDCDGNCVNDTDEDNICDELDICPEDQFNDTLYPNGICDNQDVLGCDNDYFCNYDPDVTWNDGSCSLDNCPLGCMISYACNYCEECVIPGPCDYDSCAGCTDQSACNYNETASINNGTCDYSCICLDEQACNFGAEEDCIYAEEGTDCECVSGVPILYLPGSTIGDNMFTIIDCDGNIIAEMALGENSYYNDCLVLDDNYIINLSSNSFSGGWNEAYLIIADSTYTFSEGFFASFELGDCSVIEGCMDPEACNYNSDATYDDASCLFMLDCLGECGGAAVVDDCGVCDDNTSNDNETCVGCTNLEACNYDQNATIDNGTCDYSCWGCTDDTACNYNNCIDSDGNLTDCTIDDGSCFYPLDACTDCDGNNIGGQDCAGVCGGGSIEDDCGECNGDNSSCSGCIDDTACNYDETATIDNGTCDYSCWGCMDPEACNYNPEVTNDDGSCEYSMVWFLDINGDGCGNSCFADIFENMEGVVDACYESLPILDFSGATGFNNWPNAIWVDNDDCYGSAEYGSNGVLVEGCMGLDDSGIRKQIIAVFDILGREISLNSESKIVLYIYDDGSVEKKYIVK